MKKTDVVIALVAVGIRQKSKDEKEKQKGKGKMFSDNTVLTVAVAAMIWVAVTAFLGNR